MAATGPTDPTTRSSQWARRYPPLAALLVALVIAVLVMPSALNLPNSEVSSTLEYAPVPPEEEAPPLQSGNVSQLALGKSPGLEQGGLPGGDAGGSAGDAGLGKSPRTKRCVGNPPRQTEDPLSPPCVADFRGDNGGATHEGVTASEVRVLFYIQGGITFTNACRDPNQETPEGEYVDLAAPPQPNEHCSARGLRVWQKYFNDRYQTYNRFVHFFIYYSGNLPTTAEERKADAADNFAKVKPFAIISAAEDFNDEYLQAMARRGVLAFDAEFGRDAEFFLRHPGRIWGFFPSLQQAARVYGGFVCRKVIGKPVSRWANPGDVGKPRKLGLVYTTDPGFPELRAFKDYVIEEARRRCGFDLSKVPTATFPSAGKSLDTRYPPTYAQRAMADFKQKGVTTIIWPAGLETNFSAAGASLDYRPEVVAAGDRQMESGFAASFQEQSFWDHAFVVSWLAAVPDELKTPCYIAYRETDPDSDTTDAEVSGCEIYDFIRQLFIGIQVAGPRLTPETMDQGFHAIPHVASTMPTIPSCFYELGDYTCIKDAMLVKWDRTANSNQGCYRLVAGAVRWFGDTWPDDNVDAQLRPDDPCNDYAPTTRQNFGAPQPGNL